MAEKRKQVTVESIEKRIALLKAKVELEKAKKNYKREKRARYN